MLPSYCTLIVYMNTSLPFVLWKDNDPIFDIHFLLLSIHCYSCLVLLTCLFILEKSFPFDSVLQKCCSLFKSSRCKTETDITNDWNKLNTEVEKMSYFSNFFCIKSKLFLVMFCRLCSIKGIAYKIVDIYTTPIGSVSSKYLFRFDCNRNKIMKITFALLITLWIIYKWFKTRKQNKDHV